MHLGGEIQNPLTSGRYFLDCWVRDERDGSPMAVQGLRLLPFVVYGTTAPHGVVTVQADVRASQPERERA